MNGRAVAALLACACPLGAFAQTPVAAAAASEGPLTLAEVLRASARAAPQIVEALARVREAEGRALSAEGAFDTVFDVDARSRVLGYYDGTVVDARAYRPLTRNGGQVYGGYRLSRGDFPIYEDANYTDRLGEVKVGGLFALLRDRLVDERRTRRTLAAADVNIARFEVAATAIGVQRRAVDAYQTWVGTGLRLAAYRDLLTLAEDRRGAIERQVQLGARPAILLTENDQNLVRRRALVARAEQDFAAAANALSLYYRDAEGRPVLVAAARVPADAAALGGLPSRGQAATAARPDLQSVLARVDQSTARLALAENELRPRLDLRGELAKDLGDAGLGGRTRSPFEAVAGVRFSVPLQNRAAKGRVAEVRAQIDSLRTRGRFLREQIAVEVEGIVIALDGSERLARIAEEERGLADRLAAAERRRFDLGSSDFFLVNQREETATDARVRLVDAQARVADARAELAAATANAAALGLPDSP